MTIVLNGDTGLIVSGNTNTLAGVTVGQGAGAVSTNTAVGASALAANTSGLDNAAFGYAALNLNTTGTYNTAVGRTALYANTTGSVNTAIGRSALESNTTGGNNTAMGMQSLASNTTASYNTAVGYQAAYGTTTGAYNASFGQAAFNSNTTGNYNTALGTQSLASNTTASNNTAVGYQAGYANTTGTYNLFMGYITGVSNTTGSQNTFVGGLGAGNAVTTGGKNTIIGNYSGNNGGLDIRTTSNSIVLSDGDGSPRLFFDSSTGIWKTDSNTVGSASGFWGQTGNFVVYTSGNNFYQYNGSYYLVTTAGGSTSDIRTKTNIQPLSGALDKVCLIRGVSFEFIETPVCESDKGVQIGVIAQEVEAQFPEIVVTNSDGIKSVRYDKLVAPLIEAIKELKAEVDSLKAQINGASA